MAAGGQRDGRQLIAATDRRLLVVDATEAAPQAVGYEKVESAQMGRRGTLEVSTDDRRAEARVRGRRSRRARAARQPADLGRAPQRALSPATPARRAGAGSPACRSCGGGRAGAGSRLRATSNGTGAQL